MGLYNFKARFAPRILDGSKTHTIRPLRVHEDRPGNILHLYTGLRTKSTQLLMRVPCVKVESIEIDACGHECMCDATITIEGVQLSPSECDQFAQRDGFDSFEHMMEFWSGRVPFRGHIIHWRFPEAA